MCVIATAYFIGRTVRPDKAALAGKVIGEV
jgi:hypothetical protein